MQSCHHVHGEPAQQLHMLLYQRTPSGPAFVNGRREDAFGHGVLDISADGRNAYWVWKSNTGSHAVSTDSVTLRRDVTACPQRAFGTQ